MLSPVELVLAIGLLIVVVLLAVVVRGRVRDRKLATQVWPPQQQPDAGLLGAQSVATGQHVPDARARSDALAQTEATAMQ